MPSDPTTPLRAQHRLMQEMLGAGGVSPRPEELDLVAKVFVRAGGSWVGIYEGSGKDVTLLKKCLKVAVDKGFLTKAPNWSE